MSATKMDEADDPSSPTSDGSGPQDGSPGKYFS